MNSAKEFGRHWRTLAGCTIAASIGTIGFYAYTGGAFVRTLTQEAGYTRDQLSFATMLLSISVAVCAPIAGWLMDRYGALRLVAAAVFGEALAFAVLALAPAEFHIYAMCIVLLAVLGVGTTPPGFARLVTARFDHSRGLALGIMICGLGVMAITGPIWATWAVSNLGWRGGYGVMAGLVLLLGGVGVLLIRSDTHDPAPALERHERVAGGSVSAFRRTLFWTMLIGFLAPALFSGGYLLHLISLLGERGFSPGNAAIVQSFIGLAVLVGRLGSGAALDRFPAPAVAATAFTASGISCVLLLSSDPVLISIGAFGIGLTIGAELDIMAYFISRYFGVAGFGRNYGLAYGCLITAGGISPVLISRIADTGGYSTALIISAIGTVAGAVILLFMPDPRRYGASPTNATVAPPVTRT